MNLLENQQAAEKIDGIYQDLEASLLRNIARHLRGWEQPIDTDLWLMQKLAEIGRLNRENISIIARMSGISQTAAERMLNDTADEAVKLIDPGLRYMAQRNLADRAVAASRSKNVKQVIGNLKKQSKDTLNLCNTTMLYKARDAYKNTIRDIAREVHKILDSGAADVVTGVESRQQAMRRCIRQLNDKGIAAYVDKRGREWTPEAYVNMAMRNTARQTAEEVQTARCRDAGVNLIQIDSHSGARPKCAKDQGKIFSLDNTSGETTDLYGKKIRYYPWNSSSYGKPDGILGINCRHHKWPFAPGISIQRYFPTEDMDANNDLYKRTQIQRALERDVRKQKRECMLYDEVGDKEAFEEAAVKLKQKEANLRQYVDKDPDLHRRKDREQVVGFDKRISAEAVAANKGYAKAKNTDIIPIKDTIIHKAVGAKSRNYDIVDPETGNIYHFAEGTRIQNSEVFAGRGTKHSLHSGVPEGLTEQFGGTVSKWQHCKGHGIIDYDGEERPAEVHWFQEETVGKVRFKVKRWEDEKS